jgi:hypothetical protein
MFLSLLTMDRVLAEDKSKKANKTLEEPKKKLSKSQVKRLRKILESKCAHVSHASPHTIGAERARDLAMLSSTNVLIMRFISFSGSDGWSARRCWRRWLATG